MGIILVYDCTEEQTFHNITNWLTQIEQHATDDVVKILVANKTDLPNKVIETERGEQLAAEYGLNFFETSAKTGDNINELFYAIAQKIMKDKPQLTATNSGASQQSTRMATANNSAYSQSESRQGLQLGSNNSQAQQSNQNQCC